MSPDLLNDVGNGEVLTSGWRTKENSLLGRRRLATPPGPRGVQLDAALFEDLLLVLGELDLLLDSLPETKVREFAKSETFPRYKRLLQVFFDAPVERDPPG
jgi:hypothetical protein